MRSPTVKAFSLGMIAGSFLTAGTLAFAFPVKADMPADYAEVYGVAVCSTLDDFPSFAGIIGIGQAIVKDGLTYEQAGEVIGMSVVNICPRHAGLLMRFINTYGPEATA